MRSLSNYKLGRLLIRFVSASAVHIALSASFTTPHPAVAHHPGPTAITRADSPPAGSAADANGNRGDARSPEPSWTADCAEPGFGWG
jgi:hypothetical protein